MNSYPLVMFYSSTAAIRTAGAVSLNPKQTLNPTDLKPKTRSPRANPKHGATVLNPISPKPQAQREGLNELVGEELIMEFPIRNENPRVQGPSSKSRVQDAGFRIILWCLKKSEEGNGRPTIRVSMGNKHGILYVAGWELCSSCSLACPCSCRNTLHSPHPTLEANCE